MTREYNFVRTGTFDDEGIGFGILHADIGNVRCCVFERSAVDVHKDRSVFLVTAQGHEFLCFLEIVELEGIASGTSSNTIVRHRYLFNGCG